MAHMRDLSPEQLDNLLMRELRMSELSAVAKDAAHWAVQQGWSSAWAEARPGEDVPPLDMARIGKLVDAALVLASAFDHGRRERIDVTFARWRRLLDEIEV